MIDRYEVKEISSIWKDETKFSKYLLVEKALLHGLKEDYPTQNTLNKIDKVDINLDRILEIEKTVRHDVIAFCTSITEQLSESDARYFHWGVTSSDIIDTAHSLLLKESLQVIEGDFKELLNQLYTKSDELKSVPCMGRSHGINAEPMSAGVKFLNHYSELYRRFLELENFSKNELTAQFSGAVGNYTVLTLEQEQKAADFLNLEVEPVSSQIISRDRISKLTGIISNYSVALERLCIEIRHLHHSNIGELAEGFGKGQKGSSTMPHKKNPISAENLSGIARMLRTYHQAALDNNLLWHERDISHSSAERIFLPDILGLMSYSLRRMTSTIKNIVIFPEKMSSNIPSNNYFFSSLILHKLLDTTEMRREDIYKIVQKISFESIEKNHDFLELVKNHFPDLAKDLDTKAPKQEIIRKYYLGKVDKIFHRVNQKYPNLS